MQFRTLRADEIECRVGQCVEKGCTLLLYQDSRCGMILLDEVVGAMNWTREHTFKDGKLYCKVGIWDEDKGVFVYKEDVGTESNTEQEKGQASDSFKRACVNWGIGRELYTAPFVWINLKSEEVKVTDYQGKKKYQLVNNIKFRVAEIDYDDKRNINKLIITDNNNAIRYSFGANVKVDNKPKQTPKPKEEAPKTPQQPQQNSNLLTADEFKLIKSNEELLNYMKQVCGVHKYQEYGESDQAQITNMMREKINEIRGRQ